MTQHALTVHVIAHSQSALAHSSLHSYSHTERQEAYYVQRTGHNRAQEQHQHQPQNVQDMQPDQTRMCQTANKGAVDAKTAGVPAIRQISAHCEGNLLLAQLHDCDLQCRGLEYAKAGYLTVAVLLWGYDMLAAQHITSTMRQR